jgi:hypothetical protein
MSMNKTKDGFGAPGLTYIKEKQMEQRLGRSIQNEIDGKQVWWGKLNEKRAYNIIIKDNLEYDLETKNRFVHPSIERWTGMPDTLRKDVVGDIKCPFSLKSYCTAVDSFGDVEAFKKSKPDWYWQLVSNAILCDKARAEIIVYVPYLSELAEIREDCEMFDGNQNKVARFAFAEDDDLPYLIEGGHYKNVEIFEFEVPQEDKDLLTNRVKLAVQYLNI